MKYTEEDLRETEEDLRELNMTAEQAIDFRKEAEKYFALREIEEQNEKEEYERKQEILKRKRELAEVKRQKLEYIEPKIKCRECRGELYMLEELWAAKSKWDDQAKKWVVFEKEYNVEEWSPCFYCQNCYQFYDVDDVFGRMAE